MKEKTINGIEVFIFNLNGKYLVLQENQFYVTKEKPATDQELLALQRELYNVRREIYELSRLNA